VALVPIAFGPLVALWLACKSALLCSHILIFPSNAYYYILHSGDNGYSETSYISDGLHDVTFQIKVAACLPLNDRVAI